MTRRQTKRASGSSLATTRVCAEGIVDTVAVNVYIEKDCETHETILAVVSGEGLTHDSGEPFSSFMRVNAPKAIAALIVALQHLERNPTASKLLARVEPPASGDRRSRAR